MVYIGRSPTKGQPGVRFLQWAMSTSPTRRFVQKLKINYSDKTKILCVNKTNRPTIMNYIKSQLRKCHLNDPTIKMFVHVFAIALIYKRRTGNVLFSYCWQISRKNPGNSYKNIDKVVRFIKDRICPSTSIKQPVKSGTDEVTCCWTCFSILHISKNELVRIKSQFTIL